MSESEEEDFEAINWWLDFFADAGIPPNSAAQFAVNFSEHRIPKEREIINELSIEEWRELGVDLLGDRLTLKNFAKHGKKKKRSMKKPRVHVSSKTAEVMETPPQDEIAKMISHAKEVASPIERQSVGDERVRSENPFRKSTQNVKRPMFVEAEEEEEDVEYMEEMTSQDVEEEFEEDATSNPVQFSVTLGNIGRKRALQMSDDRTSPKITRTIGSVQENVVSSTAKVNVTFGTKTGSSGPKISCSSFGKSSGGPTRLDSGRVVDRLGGKPASGGGKIIRTTSAKSRLGSKSVKSRLGQL